MAYNDVMPMTDQEVEAYRLAQYLHQQAGVPPPKQSGAAGLGGLVGTGAGHYAGNEALNAINYTPAQGQLTSEGIAAITGENGLFTPAATNMSIGTATPPAGIGITPYLGAGGAALSAYGLSKAIGANDKKAGAMSGAGLGLGLGAAAPLLGFGPLGWGALGLAALGGGAGGAILTSLLGHESTRDHAKKNTGQLLKQSSDPRWQAYVNGMREQYAKAPTGPAYAGKYNTWDEYKKAGLQASDLTGVLGNLKTFGPEYANQNFDRQKQITQALIDANLYESKKGEVQVTDALKAKALYDQIMKTPAPKGSNPTVAVPVATPSAAPVVTFVPGVNGTKVPVFSKSPEYVAYLEAKKDAKS